MSKKDKIWIAVMAIICMSIVLVGVVIGELLINRDKEHEENLVHDTMMNSGSLMAQGVQRNIAEGIFATQTLEALLRTNNFELEKFDSWGRQLTYNNTSASVVQLAPKGIVTKIYPLKGNEEAVGHDLLKDKRRNDGALKAVTSREVTFVGPIKLIQNGKYAVIARKPIFRVVNGDESFWGFSIALLLVEDMIPKQIHLLEKQKLYVKLEGDDPDSTTKPVFYISESWNEHAPINLNVKVPNGEWILSLSHAPIKNKYYNVFRYFIFILSSAVGIYVFTQQYRMRLKQKEIMALNERLTDLSLRDDLTGIGNRRASMQLLEYEIAQCLRYGQHLSVAMIDLDFFKQVNDEHGHPVGDKLLRHVACCIKGAVRKSDVLFRIGGDEFLLVFPQTGLEDCQKAVCKMVRNLKDKPCLLGQNELPIKLSIGLAEYDVKETLECLLGRVDEKLYKAKDSGRDSIIF